MEIDPEQIETARDAALRAARWHEPPQPPHALETERQRSMASTLRLIGHPATNPDVVSPLSDNLLGNAAEPDDSGQEMLGGPDPAGPLAMAPSAVPSPMSASALPASAVPDSFASGSDFDLGALSADLAPEFAPSALDPLAAPPAWNAPPIAASGDAPSTSQSPDDPFASAPDDSPASVSIPTALSPASGQAAIPPTAADVDWSDPSIASEVQSPTRPVGEDSEGFEIAGEPALDSQTTAPPSPAGENTISPPSDERDDAPFAPSSAAAAGGQQAAAAIPATLEIRLTDMEEVTRNIVAQGNALAETAAKSVAESAVDERISELSTLECMRASQRDAANGFF